MDAIDYPLAGRPRLLSTEDQLAFLYAHPDKQNQLIGRWTGQDFSPELAAPKALPRPSISEIIVETYAALSEYVPVARKLFQLPDTWALGPTQMTWDWRGSCCRDRKGQYCLWFDFLPLVCGADEDFSVALEYGIYRNDPVIGQIATTDWRVHVRKTVAHELAHAVQLSLPHVASPLHKSGQFYEGLGIFRSGHGPFFQEIYVRLRAELINPLVPADSVGKAGARTRVKTPPDLAEVPHPLVGKVIQHPKHGRLEAVIVQKTAVLTIGGPRDMLTSVPIARFQKLCTG